MGNVLIIGDNDMEEIMNVKFKLVGIDQETIKTTFQGKNLSDLSEDNLKYQFKIETIIDMSANTIVVIPSARYALQDDQLAEFSARFLFSVENIKAVITVNREAQQITTQAELISTILGVAYNTLRGIAYTSVKNTSLASFPLPLVDVKTLMFRNGISIVD